MFRAVISAILVFATLGSPLAAKEEVELGSVTNFPIPRFVSMKASEANIRRGPSLSHRIDWVFLRRNMPLMVTAEHGHWRRVQDRDGVGGWIHYSLLSGSRTVMIEEDMMALFRRPDPATPIVARLELGVIASLGECDGQWCKVTAGGYKGWAPKTSLWGIQPTEIRE